MEKTISETTTTYTCECGFSRTYDHEYLENYPTAAREAWEAEVRKHCTCPEGDVYTNLVGGEKISIEWNRDQVLKMGAVREERERLSSQLRSHTVLTAVHYPGEGWWEFYNRPVYTLPNGEPDIWIEF